MRRFVDLHTHSTASDGCLPPREIVRWADARRLAAVALTDHDTLGGLSEAAEAARAFPSLRFIPGVEVSARVPRGTLHILGLGIDMACPSLAEMIVRLRAARDERNPLIVAKLRAMGFPISMDDVLEVARSMGILPMSTTGVSPVSGGGKTPVGRMADTAAPFAAETDTPLARTVGRVHIAEALRRKGIVRSVAEAFDRFIGSGKPAYVEKDRIDPADVIRSIVESRGVAVLAHPVQLKCENLAQLERIVKSLVGAGLGAIEAYHSEHTPQQMQSYLKLARKYRLGVTGGSDFHGDAKPGVRLGRPRVPLETIEGRLRKLLLGRG